MKFVVFSQGVRSEVVKHILDAGQNGDVIAVKDVAALGEALGDADALILQDFTWSPEVEVAAKAASRLKTIQLLTSGYDRIAKTGGPSGVTICNARGAFSHSVAVHAVTLYLALLRGIPTALSQQQKPEWQRDFANALTVPQEREVLIVGFGSIGQEIARLLRPFGPMITGVTRSGTPHPLADAMIKASDTKAAFSRSDAIFLCMPLGGDTRHAIGKAELEACRRNAVIVNVGRGGLWDQEALAQALHDGLIAGAGTDVTEPEPLPAEHALWRAPNFILSPHVSGASGEVGYRSQAQVAIDNILRMRKGEPLGNIIQL
jgi:phosphoglycerate dehydrogenase-like enzyme